MKPLTSTVAGCTLLAATVYALPALGQEQLARSLAANGYLLESDIPQVVEHSATEWDYLSGTE